MCLLTIPTASFKDKNKPSQKSFEKEQLRIHKLGYKIRFWVTESQENLVLVKSQTHSQ